MSTKHLYERGRDEALQNRVLTSRGWVSLLVLFASFLLFDGFYVAALDSSQHHKPLAINESRQESICPPTVSYGETIQCSIDVPGEVDAYGFSANAGDVILARMSANQCCNYREIGLYEPGGGLIVTELGYTRVEITQTLSAPGDYTLTTGFEGGSGGSLTGEYELHLQRLNGPGNAAPIAYGQTITGTVDLAAEYEAHSFSADGGDVILARMSSGQCCNGREIRLHGPSGALMISNVGYTRVEITQTISSPGNYTLLTGFEGGSGGSLTGEYELHLQRLNGPGNAVPIAHGQTIPGVIDYAAEFDAYSFSANAGDEISARMSSSQCCNRREIRLYGSEGELLASELDYASVEMTHSFSTTGNYSLLVSFNGGSGGSLTGNYDLSLTCLVLPCGAQPVHKIHLPLICHEH